MGIQQNGLGIVRALGRQGVPVIAVADAYESAYHATRFARVVRCQDLKGEGLIDTLEEIGRALTSAVLVLTLDRSVQLVSEHRARLEPWYRHSLPPDDVIRALMNKATIERFAVNHGFEVPRTFAIRNESTLEACIDGLRLPCVLKPQVKTVAFTEHSPQKAFFIRSFDELRHAWQVVAQWEPEVVVQEWIDGPESNLVFCLYYFDSAGQPAASFTGRKIRQFIPHVGTACAAEPWTDERALESGIRFFQAAGYTGFGAIEFKVDHRGRYYLIEPTVGRTEHIFALAEANGVNLPFVGYCDMAGLKAPPQRQRRRPVVYVDWRRDLRAARALVNEGSLSWTGWLRSIARPAQHALFAWDDPSPFMRRMRERASNRAGRARRRVEAALKRRVDAWRDPSGLAGVELGAAVTPRPPLRPAVHLDAALDWLCAAHDAGNGGVARGYTFSTRSGYDVGWQAAYPETTGYIVPTLFDAAGRLSRNDLRQRACRMADWELELQLDGGGFPGGTVTRRGAPPVVFNTGMVLLGLSRAHKETGHDRYLAAMARAGRFLAESQSLDGSWRRFVNVEGVSRVHAYDCLVDWGLVLASQALGDTRLADTARRNLDFTLTLQSASGWFDCNALRPARNHVPLTHTIGYAASGLLEAGLLLDESRYIAAARLTASAVLTKLEPDGFLAGEFDAQWNPRAEWSCLTGTAQMAILWLRLFELTREDRFAEASRRALKYLMSRHEVEKGGPGLRGGMSGSFPVGGRYGRFQHLNWAGKFLVDALLLAERLGELDFQDRELATSGGVNAGRHLQ